MQYPLSTDVPVASRGCAVPDALIGVWHRLSISIADAAPFEDSDVVWLQAQLCFADLRIPLDSRRSVTFPAAFSGQTAWQEPSISFHRDLDWQQSSIEDRAELRIDGDTLIEHGMFTHEHRRIPYVETWRREHGAHGVRRVLDGRTIADGANRISMRLVEVDGTALVLKDERPLGGGFAASQFLLKNGTWHLVRHVGAVVIAPPPAMSAFEGPPSSLTLPSTFDPTWSRRTWVLRELSHGSHEERSRS